MRASDGLTGMMMSRKDYERAAKQINASFGQAGLVPALRWKQIKAIVVEEFVTFFQADNPSFNPPRFREACNVR